MCPAVNGSTCEMWFSARMKPPRSGMFSPPIHSRMVVASSTGFMIGTAMLHAHPRFCCNLRTVTCAGYSVKDRDPCHLQRPDRIGAMPDHAYAVLVPVKPPAVGKSRLVGLGPDTRRALAEAFALDTVTACLAAQQVAEVLVVTDDARLSSVLGALGS